MVPSRYYDESLLSCHLSLITGDSPHLSQNKLSGTPFVTYFWVSFVTLLMQMFNNECGKYNAS